MQDCSARRCVALIPRRTHPHFGGAVFDAWRECLSLDPTVQQRARLFFGQAAIYGLSAALMVMISVACSQDPQINQFTPTPEPASTTEPAPTPTPAPTPSPTATPAPASAPSRATTAAPTPSPTPAPTPAPTPSPTPTPTPAPTPLPTTTPVPPLAPSPTPVETAAPAPPPTPTPARGPTPSPATTLTSDRAALVALYYAADGANWTNATNWLSDSPLSHWYGVGTDFDDRVTRLDLTVNQLNAPELGRFANLTYGQPRTQRSERGDSPEVGGS